MYLFNSLFMGMIFVSILDFLYFIGLKINYFDFYGIKEYFNIIFIDNQNFYILIPLSFVVGYLLLYNPFSKFFMKIYIGVILLSSLTLYQPIGKKFGDIVFKKEQQSLKVGSISFKGDILYEGRTFIYVYREDLKKSIKFSKKELLLH